LSAKIKKMSLCDWGINWVEVSAVDVFFGATLEQRKDGSQLISATEAMTWIRGCLEGKRRNAK
jgi:hypothetical protein